MKLRMSLLAMLMVAVILATSGCCCPSILTPVLSEKVEDAENAAIKAEIKNAYSAYVAECAVEGMGYASIEEYVFYNGEDYYIFDGSTVNSYDAGYYIGTYQSWDIHWAADSFEDESWG